MNPSAATPGSTTTVDHDRWFAKEVQPHHSLLKAYVRHAFPTVRDVDDVVQESYLRIWKARAAHPIQSAKAFLFRVARNIALDSVRHRHVCPIDAVGDLGRLSVIDDKAGVAEAIGTTERIAILVDALDALPSRHREVILLCKLQGRSYREAAAQLHISEKTVAEHIYRGAQRLGEELHRRGIRSFGQ